MGLLIKKKSGHQGEKYFQKIKNSLHSVDDHLSEYLRDLLANESPFSSSRMPVPQR